MALLICWHLTEVLKHVEDSQPQKTGIVLRCINLDWVLVGDQLPTIPQDKDQHPLPQSVKVCQPHKLTPGRGGWVVFPPKSSSISVELQLIFSFTSVEFQSRFSCLSPAPRNSCARFANFPVGSPQFVFRVGRAQFSQLDQKLYGYYIQKSVSHIRANMALWYTLVKTSISPSLIRFFAFCCPRNSLKQNCGEPSKKTFQVKSAGLEIGWMETTSPQFQKYNCEDHTKILDPTVLVPCPASDRKFTSLHCHFLCQ